MQAPQAPKPWQGVRSAKEFGSVNYQIDMFTREPPTGSEDCLYLNVYTPNIKPLNHLPVMVWIHGGGFFWGSGNDDVYGPEFLVRQGVILVTFNYRLGAFGFLCLHTEDVPGNAGMKDQVAALRWVKSNIEKLGGDPGNVTIFGESAGAASVSYHLISPMSKGLFKRAIVQSGSALSWWAQDFEPRERALLLARKLGFDSEDDKELYEFFKSQPMELFVNLKLPVTFAEELVQNILLNFSVVSERKFGNNERFFYGDVKEAVINGIHDDVEVITGYVEDEYLIMFGLFDDLDKYIYQANNCLEFFVPKAIAVNCSIKDQLEVGRKMKKYYLKNEKVSMKNIEQLGKFITCELFIHRMTEWHKICAQKNKNNQYFYKFTCKTERNYFKNIFRVKHLNEGQNVVCHCDDLAYLFTNKLVPQKIDKNSTSFQMIDRVTKLWTNFAKYG